MKAKRTPQHVNKFNTHRIDLNERTPIITYQLFTTEKLQIYNHS